MLRSQCYLEEISFKRTMTVFDWIKMAQALAAEGLEMYEGFFVSLEDGYIDSVGEAIAAASARRCPCSAAPRRLYQPGSRAARRAGARVEMIG